MGALLSVLVFCATLATPATGASVSGRLTTSLYGYEGAEPDSSSVTHLWAHQVVRLDVGDVGVKGLSFSTYLRGTTDLSEQADGEPRLRVYSAYLTWKDRTTRVRIGRQRIGAGVGYGSIDGVRGDAEYAGLRLTAYAGALVPLNTSTQINSPGTAHLWGLRLSTERFFDSAVAISFADRERDPGEYDEPGELSGLVGYSGHRPAVQRRLVGVDAYRRFAGGHRLSGRLDGDLHDERLRRAELKGRYQVNRELGLELGWMRREPSIYHNSILSVFDYDSYQEVRARVHYQVSPAIDVSGHAAALLYDGDDAQRLGVTVAVGGNYSVGYYRSMGYAGANDGLVGSVYYPLSRKLTLRGQLDLAAYGRYENAPDRDGLVTGVIGATYRPNRATFLEVQLQGLRNPTYTSDLRVFVRGSWRFFKGWR